MRRWLLRLLLPRAAPGAMVELVMARPEGEGVALTYVVGGRSTSLWLPRHRAARLLGELAQALA